MGDSVTDSLMALITVVGGIWFLKHYSEFIKPGTFENLDKSISELFGPRVASALSLPTTTQPAPQIPSSPPLPSEIQSALSPLPRVFSPGRVMRPTGPVYNQGSCKVWFIFWGKPWDNHPDKEPLKAALTKLLSSSYFDGLAQYGVSRPQLGGFVDNKTYPLPSNKSLDWQEQPKVIMDSVKNKTVPDPAIVPPFNNFWFVWVPPGYDVPGFHGMHTSWGTPDGKTFYWGAVVHGNQPAVPSNVDNATQAFTHEFVDNLTDPAIGTGYVMDSCPHVDFALGHCEIAQFCGYYLKRLPNGVLVEAYYSEKDRTCIVPGTRLLKSDLCCIDQATDV